MSFENAYEDSKKVHYLKEKLIATPSESDFD